MTTTEAQTAETNVAGFEQPYEFLNPFVDEDQVYGGLYSYLGKEIVDGREDSVRGFASEMSLDIGDQSAYASLLRSMQLQRYMPAAMAPEMFHPQLDAAMGYLKYRLTIGIMEPAVVLALDNRDPEHVNTQASRIIAATEMVRGFVNDQFTGNPGTEVGPPISLQEAEARSHLLQFFSGEYRSQTETGIVEELLASSLPLQPLSTESDGHHFFDVKDLSTRLMYVIPGKKGVPARIPTVDELDEIIRLQRTEHYRPETRDTNTNGNGNHARRPQPLDAEIIRRQVVSEVFSGLGFMPPESPLLKHLLPLDKLLPGGKLEGRDVARVAAATLLNTLEAGGRVTRINRGPGRKAVLPEEAREQVTERLRSIVSHFSDRWMPADAMFRLSEQEYIRVYGEPPTARDFWAIFGE